MKKYKQTINVILLMSFSFLAVFWMLSIDNSLAQDDVTWMLHVSTHSYEEIFSFLPHAVYNDRPIGIVFLKFLYSAFGLDYSRHHAILVIIHLLNVLLAFCVVINIFRRKYGNSDRCFTGGLIAAGFFGIWSRTHMAVQWDAAIFDLLGTFWSLLSIFFYLRYRNDKKYIGQNMFFTILFYYFAIRTKEMFLVLPILFVLYEVWEMLLDKAKKPITIVTIINLLICLCFITMLFYYKFVGGGNSLTNDMDNPYYQTFNPLKLVVNLFRYCILCFDLENGGWVYSFSVTGFIGTIVVICGLIIAVIRAIMKKQFEIFLCYAAIGVSISMVLPMINMTHVLYFPSLFVGLLLVSILIELKISDNGALFLICLFFVLGGMKGNINAKEYWLTGAKNEKRLWDDIKNINAPQSGSTIYVKNIGNEDYATYFFRQGAICQLIYNDTSLSVTMLQENEGAEYLKPYVVWEYKDGRVQEIDRNEERYLSIQEIYEYPQQDGSLILGIVPDKITESMLVYIDNIELTPSIGEDFISVVIPAELIRDKEQVAIKVGNVYGTLSDDYMLILND